MSAIQANHICTELLSAAVSILWTKVRHFLWKGFLTQVLLRRDKTSNKTPGVSPLRIYPHAGSKPMDVYACTHARTQA